MMAGRKLLSAYAVHTTSHEPYAAQNCSRYLWQEMAMAATLRPELIIQSSQSGMCSQADNLSQMPETTLVAGGSWASLDVECTRK